MGSYGQAKLALILFTYELARRLEGTGVTVNALHPGLIASNAQTGLTGLMAWFVKLLRPFMITVEQGAQNTLSLATSPQVEGVTGKYFSEKQEKKSARGSYDQALAQRLWRVSEQLVARSVPDTDSHDCNT
jgi:NAD(P)-dependent dehydrogenase (short-subunit alcohol dehydrogenase family)